MISVKTSDAAFGATITGLDLNRVQGRVAAEPLLAALHEHKVVSLPKQDLNPERFGALGHALGRPQPHVLDHLHLPGHPEIIVLSNIIKDGKPIGLYEGAAFWHSDMSYEAEPSSLTMVYAVQVPETGGQTHFLDLASAYDALPDTMKKRIDGLTVRHVYGNRLDLEGETRQRAEPLANQHQQDTLKNPVFHPLVRRHPGSGRKTLYAVTGTPRGIVGMPDDEALELLDELAAHVDSPAFRASHHYEVGDLVMWDNAQTVHMASLIAQSTGPQDARLLYRISLKGYPDWMTEAAA